MARVKAALDGDDAHGFLHGGVDDADHACGEAFEGKIRLLLLQPFLRESASAFEIELKVSAEKAMRLQAAEKKICVGDGRQRATAVTDGAGIGAGGFGTHAQSARGVEAGQGPAACANGVNVEHGNAYGESSDFGLAAGASFAVNEGDVC